MIYPILAKFGNLARTLVRAAAGTIGQGVKTAEAIGASKTFIRAYRAYSIAQITKAVLNSDESVETIVQRVGALPYDPSVEDAIKMFWSSEVPNAIQANPNMRTVLSTYGVLGPYQDVDQFTESLRKAWDNAIQATNEPDKVKSAKVDFALSGDEVSTPLSVVFSEFINEFEPPSFVDKSIPGFDKGRNRIFVIPPFTSAPREREYPQSDPYAIAVPITRRPVKERREQ